MTIDQSKLKCDPAKFAKALSAEGIPAGVGYIGKPIYMSPVFQDHQTYGDSGCPFTCPHANPRKYEMADCPNTVEILANIITLPCNEFFSEQDVEDIGEAIMKVAGHYKRS